MKRWADTLWPPRALDKHVGALPFIIIHFQRDRLLVCLLWQAVLVIWRSITAAKSPRMCKKSLSDKENVLRLTMQVEKSKFCHFPSHVTCFLISLKTAFKLFFFQIPIRRSCIWLIPRTNTQLSFDHPNAGWTFMNCKVKVHHSYITEVEQLE